MALWLPQKQGKCDDATVEGSGKPILAIALNVSVSWKA
jgi:hypothetical protein